MSTLVRALLISLAVTVCKSERRPEPGPPTTVWVPDRERDALAASFLGRNRGDLKRLLHDSVIVQPPPPDSAHQGAAAVSYLLELANNSSLAESWLTPTAVAPEGTFLLERGVWYLTAGDRRLRGSYVLRWRNTPEGLKVVLWRWSRFR